MKKRRGDGFEICPHPCSCPRPLTTLTPGPRPGQGGIDARIFEERRNKCPTEFCACFRRSACPALKIRQWRAERNASA